MAELKIAPYQGERKIAAIKLVREYDRQLSLKDAKDLVELGGYAFVPTDIILEARRCFTEIGVVIVAHDDRLNEIEAVEDDWHRLIEWAFATRDIAHGLLTALPHQMSERADLLRLYVNALPRISERRGK